MPKKQKLTNSTIFIAIESFEILLITCQMKYRKPFASNQKEFLICFIILCKLLQTCQQQVYLYFSAVSNAFLEKIMRLYRALLLYILFSSSSCSFLYVHLILFKLYITYFLLFCIFCRHMICCLQQILILFGSFCVCFTSCIWPSY